MLLLLLLAGCGTAPMRHGELHQGIPMAPEAPAFEPTLDAPVTTGQPGYVGPVEHLPRSPHQRTLPQTPSTRREPGLWAGDVRARGNERDDGDDDGDRLPPPSLWGVPLPFGSIEDEGAVASVSHLCQGPLWQAGVMGSMSHSRIQAPEDWPAPRKKCAAASVYYVCALHNAERFRKEPDPAWRVRASHVMRAAEEFLNACRGLRITSDEQRMLDAVITAYLSIERR